MSENSPAIYRWFPKEKINSCPVGTIEIRTLLIMAINRDFSRPAILPNGRMAGLNYFIAALFPPINWRSIFKCPFETFIC